MADKTLFAGSSHADSVKVMFQDRVIVIATVDRSDRNAVLMEAGMDKELCSAGEEMRIAIQGALVWLRVEQSCSPAGDPATSKQICQDL